MYDRRFIIWNSQKARAVGRMSLTAPLGWVREQFAHTFDSEDAAHGAASSLNLTRYEVVPVTTLTRR